LKELAIVISPQPLELSHELFHGFKNMFWQFDSWLRNYVDAAVALLGRNSLSELSTAF
jgi:hypothetical protein